MMSSRNNSINSIDINKTICLYDTLDVLLFSTRTCFRVNEGEG